MRAVPSPLGPWHIDQQCTWWGPCAVAAQAAHNIHKQLRYFATKPSQCPAVAPTVQSKLDCADPQAALDHGRKHLHGQLPYLVAPSWIYTKPVNGTKRAQIVQVLSVQQHRCSSCHHVDAARCRVEQCAQHRLVVPGRAEKCSVVIASPPEKFHRLPLTDGCTHCTDTPAQSQGNQHKL